MWIYEKKLQFPVKIKNPDARLAKIMIEQYGGLYSFRVYTKGVSYGKIINRTARIFKANINIKRFL